MNTNQVNPYHLIGSRSSSTRCHRIGNNDDATHLESTGKFNSMKDIQRVLSFYDEPETTGTRSIIFVDQSHLPDELVAELRKHPNYEHFAQFCDVIAFASNVNGQYKNSGSNPSSLDDFAVTIKPIPGFAVTTPVEDGKIDIKRSDSFGSQELRNFLGDKYYATAGKLLVINLGWKGEGNLSVAECASEIMFLLNKLISA
jgi:hypothetical protein